MAENETPLSDADKIRLKRLARLGGSTQTPARPETPSATSSSATPTSTSEGEGTPTAPKAQGSAASRLLSTPLPATASSSTSTSPSPATALASSSTSRTHTTSITPKPTSSAPSSLLGKRPTPSSSSAKVSPTPPPLSKPATPQPPRLSIPYPEWEAQKVGQVFGVTLSRGDAQRSDWSLCWLKELQNEIESDEPDRPQPVKTSVDLADRLLIARLSLEVDSLAASGDSDMLSVIAGMPQNETSFEYLAGCWKRLYVAHRESLRLALAGQEKASWTAAFDKMKELIVSYIGMTLEDHTMFPQPENKPLGPAEFLPILLSLTPTFSESNGDPLTSSQNSKVQHTPAILAPGDLADFLKDLAAGFSTEMLVQVLSPTLSLFFQEWFKISPAPDLLGSDWRRYLGAVSELVKVKGIAAALPSLPIWTNDSANAAQIEYQSLLGPLTRLNVYPRDFAEIWRTYFSNPTDRKTADIDANKSNLRHTLAGLQSSLFNVFGAIVRSSPEAREAVLEYFAKVIKLNEKRAGMRVDYRTVSSDSFMTNLQYVLLKLFEPVMDVSFSKIDKVDPEYFKLSKRMDISEETKVKATKEEADEYYGSGGMDVDQAPPNFISDLFYLLNAFQHLGLNKTIGNRSTAERNIGDIEKELRRTEASRGDWAGNPALEAQGEASIKKLKGDLATLHASLHAYDVQLLDPAYTRLNLTFIDFVMTWLVRLVDPQHKHPSVTISLPLPAESPIQFRMLPEYLFENVSEYLEFISRYNADAFDDGDKDVIITFVLAFLSPGYVNNPFMKAKLVQVFSNGLIPQGYWRKGFLFDRLSVHPVSTEYLMPTLIRFFIDVEMTGGHTQFWDKFNYRRDISRIIKAMWENPLHREAFVKSAKQDFDQFIRFVNMLMSDTTFHLEESLTGLAKIHQILEQKADAAGWEALEQNERQDLDSQLRQTEGQVPWHTAMGLDHVELMRDFTATAKESFVAGEIVDRLAATLDENLATLVGPKMSELKVDNPEKFHFKPKRLLAGLAQIYLNLGNEPEFIRAVANDGRAYSKELFERFARTMKKRAIMTDAEIAGIVTFTQKVEDMRATILIEDEREIPDEFLDPLLSTLMRDPVTLPVSKVVVDRSTIRTALLSKEVDPFNNVPLKYEDCIPNPELKAQIDAWVAEGQAKQASEVMDVDSL